MRVGEVLERIYGGWDHLRLPNTFVSGAMALQGCMPLLMRETSQEELERLLGPQNYTQLRSLYRQSSTLNLWYNIEMKRVLSSLAEARIDVIALKGADVATALYSDPALRHFGDVDLMVHPGDLSTTLERLERLGYHYHQEYRFEAAYTKRAGYVYVKEVSAGYIIFEIHTSPHENEMGVTFDAGQMWKRARPITVAGVPIYGLGLEDLLLYLCWHYRSHAFERLIWLYDISLMLQRCAHQLDWTLAHRLARAQKLTATLYYCTRLCQQLFQIALPAEAGIEQLRPSPFMRRLVTRFVGDDLTILVYRSAQRERKLMQRLMVGNASLLCLVALRTLFPSPIHLGRLYMEHSRLPLSLFWLYYPLHLLFVLSSLVKKQD